MNKEEQTVHWFARQRNQMYYKLRTQNLTQKEIIKLFEDIFGYSKNDILSFENSTINGNKPPINK